jgi:hypothetical protein
MEEDLDSQSGQLCHICQNFRDDFSIQQKLMDDQLKFLAPVEVYRTRGSLASGYLDYDFYECTLRIAINLTQRYPIQHTIDNILMPRKSVDAVRLSLRIYSAEEAAGFRGSGSVRDLSLLLQRLVEEAAAHILQYRNKLSEAEFEKYPEWAIRTSTVEDEDAEEDGGDDFSVFGDAPQILNLTPKQICERIAPSDGDLSVVHCENVMRPDLRAAFREKQSRLREQLKRVSLSQLLKGRLDKSQPWRQHGNVEARKLELIAELTQPTVTYHGTRKSTIPSIVRNGFIMPGGAIPGSGEAVGVRCGSSYGRGIYSSPEPSFAMSYCENDAHPTTEKEISGMKLIVCATLMGISNTVFNDGSWQNLSNPQTGADSHVGGHTGLEYIVFESAQILPCYVVHLDWHARPSKTLEQIRSRALNVRSLGYAAKVAASQESPGEKQRKKEEKLAQARKYFAYGYGPVSGNRIIIEDVADSEDDEEEYGDYQANRIVDKNYEAQSIWDWNPSTQLGKNAVDQYSEERREETGKEAVN